MPIPGKSYWYVRHAYAACKALKNAKPQNSETKKLRNANTLSPIRKPQECRNPQRIDLFRLTCKNAPDVLQAISATPPAPKGHRRLARVGLHPAAAATATTTAAAAAAATARSAAAATATAAARLLGGSTEAEGTYRRLEGSRCVEAHSVPGASFSFLPFVCLLFVTCACGSATEVQHPTREENVRSIFLDTPLLSDQKHEKRPHPSPLIKKNEGGAVTSSIMLHARRPTPVSSDTINAAVMVFSSPIPVLYP